MKRPNRYFEIFSMSALDLFASAMGAFIIISLILFPYFPNTGMDPRDIKKLQEKLAAAQRENQRLQAEIQKQKQENQSLRTQNESLKSKNKQMQSQVASLQKKIQNQQTIIEDMEKKLRQSFLVVIIQWGTKGNDVDLHVVDPHGNEFYYKKKNTRGEYFRNSAASLSYDVTKGPGLEVWQHPKATPGRYVIYVKYFRGSIRTPVTGHVFVRNKRIPLRSITLTRKGEKPLLATVVIDSNGDARIEHSR